MKQALLYKKIPSTRDNKVQCQVCHHACTIVPEKRGICGVRENQNGILYALNYGKAIAAHIDSIEKKIYSGQWYKNKLIPLDNTN